MLFLIILPLIISVISANACSLSTFITRDDFDAVFGAASSETREQNFLAFSSAANTMNFTFSSHIQIAAFLGTVAFNTHNLSQHAALCSVEGHCSTEYDQVCRNRSRQDDPRRYFPRSAMMVSYECGYAQVDDLLSSLQLSPALLSVVEFPELLSSNLYYSYLASLAVWSDSADNASCLATTATDLSLFGTCIREMNEWECSQDGAEDRRAHIASINTALISLGCSEQMPEMLECPSTSSLGSTVSPRTSPVATTTTTVKAEPMATTPSPCAASNTSAPSCSYPTVNVTTSPPNTTTCGPTKTQCGHESVPDTTTTSSPDAAGTAEALSTVNASWPSYDPAQSAYACGIISFEAFSTLWNSSTANDSAAAHFGALSSACSIAGIQRLDVNQASYLLASIAVQAGVKSGDCSPDDRYCPRGMMKLSGLTSYRRLSVYLSSLGINYDAMLQPSLVDGNIVINYLSVIMIMQQTNCLQAASAGQFGTCLDRIHCNRPCTCSGDTLLDAIETASTLLGDAIPKSALQPFLCVQPFSCFSHDDPDAESSAISRSALSAAVIAAILMIIA